MGLSDSAYFGAAESSIRRHVAHVSTALAGAAAADRRLDAAELLRRVESLYLETLEVLARAKARRDDRGVLAAVREAGRIVALLGAALASRGPDVDMSTLSDAQLVALSAGRPWPEVLLMPSERPGVAIEIVETTSPRRNGHGT